jgi:hypothetical protein
LFSFWQSSCDFIVVSFIWQVACCAAVSWLILDSQKWASHRSFHVAEMIDPEERRRKIGSATTNKDLV